MTFDRFAIMHAFYAYATLYHQGQWSHAYTIFGRLKRLGFEPRWQVSMGGADYLDDDERAIFDRLVEEQY